MLTWYPFANIQIAMLIKKLILYLGPLNPCPIIVPMETFSTSVFNVLIRIFATTTKICTNSHSKKLYSFYSTWPLHPPTHKAANQALWQTIGKPLKRYQFLGLIHSAGELLHTPKGIPTSMAILLLSKWINTFFKDLINGISTP